MRKKPDQLRSHRWLGPDDWRSFGHRSRLKQMGFASADWEGKPLIAILNTWSDFNNCHTHFRQRAEEIKRGVWQAGGFPLEMPVTSLSETFMKPSSMFYRNMVSMEVEELLRSQPIDAAVLMTGCDKTTPALIMGATSANIPSIVFTAGPMLKGNFNGTTLGSGTDAWKYWMERCAGNLDECGLRGVEDGIARSPGHCMTMGTASTMTSIAETLGLTLPGAASIPAVHSAHSRLATETGRRIVEMVWEDIKPRDILTPPAFDNAITVDMAIGGSTNAIIHLIAMAGRCGIKLPLERFDEISHNVPVIANVRPSGEFLMEEFYDAGGLRALLVQIGKWLDLSCGTVNGKTLGENIDGAKVFDERVILPVDKPLSQAGATFVLRGNLCPQGAVIKPTCADKRLMKHTGPAVVFKDYPDLKARMDDESLNITADSVLVLQSAGPLGAPGMPEWGLLPIPTRLLKQGVRDMVRISDARMSGTSFGTCVLHVAPESAVGGPLALVRDGDLIDLDVEARSLNVRLSDHELAKRRDKWKRPERQFDRGYGLLFAVESTQADEGCDFRFLRPNELPINEPPIF
jgi:dihydroxy-acid dehydratase